MSRSCRHGVLRGGLLVAVLAATTPAVCRLTLTPIRRVAVAVDGSGLAAVPPFDTVLIGVSAAALLLGWSWLALTTTLLVLAAVPAAPPGDALPRRTRVLARLTPAFMRRLVVGVCGVALATGLAAAPASADPERAGVTSPPGSRLRGLVVPDRVVGAGGVRAPTATVTVVRGDSLWSIAARHLPDGAPAREVAAAWRALWRANAEVVGDDPDLIHPGTILRLPLSGQHHRKDIR